jgi:hypothetical protein
MGLTPDVGATLVVALDWAGTRCGRPGLGGYKMSSPSTGRVQDPPLHLAIPHEIRETQKNLIGLALPFPEANLSNARVW